MSYGLLPYAARVIVVDNPSELWQKCFKRAGGSDGAIELHYLPLTGAELGTQTITVDSTDRGVLGLAAIVIPAGTEKIVAYCRTAAIQVGDGGTADTTSPHTSTYTVASPTYTQTLQVGESIEWGLVSSSGAAAASGGSGASGGASRSLFTSNFATPVARGIAKASPGTLYAISVTNANAAVRFLHIFNQTGAVANGTVPTLSFPLAGQTGDTPPLYLIDKMLLGGGEGHHFGTGIVWGISTTELTMTLATAGEHVVQGWYE